MTIIKMWPIWSLLVLLTDISAAPSLNESCGRERVCVKKSLCKSEPLDNNGHVQIIISFRATDEPCSYLQTCCHINDVIEAEPDAPPSNKIIGCGLRNVNGIKCTLNETANSEAQFGEFPWMVAIMLDSSFIGGGAILAPNVVVTSANKVEKLHVDELRVRAGEWDDGSNEEPYPHAERSVKERIIHERYSREQRNYDIALLIVKERFSTQPNIAPICLPTHDEKFDHERCIVTGWGKKDEASKDYPHVLKKISLSVLPEAQCNNYLSDILEETFNLDPTSICAGGEKDVDACLGDGGGPLICPIKGSPNRYKLAGIVAWGIGCGLANVPGAYTNVAAFTPWISQQLLQRNIDGRQFTFNNAQP